ncbi:MAG: hypothetical protein KC503_23985 [Myxococcales bacterium]|nr:hypothetical protein [Myxococcales bacterium]
MLRVDAEEIALDGGRVDIDIDRLDNSEGLEALVEAIPAAKPMVDALG